MFASIRNGGHQCRSEPALGRQSQTAGATAAVNTNWLDRRTTDQIYDSAKIVIRYTTTLAAAQTLSFNLQARDATSGAGAGAANYETATGARLAETGAATNKEGTFEIDVNLTGAREFFGFTITPTMSAPSADTVVFEAIVILFGANKEPTSKAPALIGAI
jgi:hypothetical protein